MGPTIALLIIHSLNLKEIKAAQAPDADSSLFDGARSELTVSQQEEGHRSTIVGLFKASDASMSQASLNSPQNNSVQLMQEASKHELRDHLVGSNQSEQMLIKTEERFLQQNALSRPISSTMYNRHSIK